MAFHDVRLDEEISRGARRSVVRPIQRFNSRSRRTWRNAVSRSSLREYDVGYGLRKMEEVREVFHFWEAREGGLHAFRFKDWAEWEVDDGLIGVGDGVNAVFDLVVRYEDASGLWVRRNIAPDVSTLTVTVAGTPVTPTSVASVNGLRVRVTLPSVPSLAAQVRASFEYDVPVFFANDELDDVVDTFMNGEVPNITLREEKLL